VNLKEAARQAQKGRCGTISNALQRMAWAAYPAKDTRAEWFGRLNHETGIAAISRFLPSLDSCAIQSAQKAAATNNHDILIFKGEPLCPHYYFQSFSFFSLS
jgi:hypothetical protein